MKRVLSVILLGAMAVIFFSSLSWLPSVGDPHSAPNTHVSPYYLERSYKDTGATNVVTAIILVYRGLDTLGETAVIFIASVATIAILGYKVNNGNRKSSLDDKTGSHEVFGGFVLNTAYRYMVPAILLFAVYILFHGEYSPGGGFHAGVLFGLTILSSQLITGYQQTILSVKLAVLLAGIGVLIYAVVGLLSFFFGGIFLEHGVLPFNIKEIGLQGLSILIVEIGVAICVMATIVVVFTIMDRNGGKE
ncbi:MAG: hydrogen gas-evolving membrane-bound hydrogenase subunit E [Candidatus Loosdrechtia sp.]|uniref:hydrogen gas-evolving membrane-bound hydrogenase subunit E n=1 Tax=Candidatus Loosdrechtia sp. TaxID=3101272 RepID=UPI003A6A4935|nr:MAG: MnhB domain-containing protein [Candidatus Jettenia sp. AMX2]